MMESFLLFTAAVLVGGMVFIHFRENQKQTAALKGIELSLGTISSSLRWRNRNL